MTCLECRRRPAKRPCPARGRAICPTCCATRRLVEIPCPADCHFLDAGQRHPAAVVRRRQEADLTLLVASMGHRLSEGQLQLFFLLANVIVSQRPEGLLAVADVDIAEAAGAMAGTLEAASRGVVAELTGASPLGEGLRRRFDALLAEVGRGAGARFAPDAAVVLRGIERGARHGVDGIGSGDRDYLALLERVVPPVPDGRQAAGQPSPIVLP